MRITDHQLSDRLEGLNRKFRSGDFSPRELPERVARLGYDLTRCVLLDVLPDSGDTWVVCFMVDDGSLVEIDIDLSHPQASTIRAISPSVYRKRRGQAILGIAKKMLGDLANAV